MLRFPVSLLTATALIEAITRTVRRRQSLVRSTACAERLGCACDCRVDHVAHGGAPQNTIQDHEASDAGLGVPRATSAALEAIREILGISEEKTEECREWLELVRSVSEKPLRSKYFLSAST